MTKKKIRIVAKYNENKDKFCYGCRYLSDPNPKDYDPAYHCKKLGWWQSAYSCDVRACNYWLKAQTPSKVRKRRHAQAIRDKICKIWGTETKYYPPKGCDDPLPF